MSTTRLLDALSCRGVLVNVSVRYWRVPKQPNPEDLGLSSDLANQRLISLGHKRRLPKDCLRSLGLIESRAHTLVEGSTFPFLNGVARYLPNERLADVDAKFAELGDQFRHKQRGFLRQYPDCRAEPDRGGGGAGAVRRNPSSSLHRGKLGGGGPSHTTARTKQSCSGCALACRTCAERNRRPQSTGYRPPATGHSPPATGRSWSSAGFVV